MEVNLFSLDVNKYIFRCALQRSKTFGNTESTETHEEWSQKRHDSLLVRDCVTNKRQILKAKHKVKLIFY